MPKPALLLSVAAILLASVALLAGCASPQDLPLPPTAIPTLAPATMPAATAPGGGGPMAINQGRQVFETNCSGCHNLNNVTKVGPGLAILQTPNLSLPNGKPLNDANLADWIHSGGGAMPGFPQIQGAELNALIGYLKEATKAGGAGGATTPAAEGTPAPVAGGSPAPSAAAPVTTTAGGPGAATFIANCTVCHTLNNEVKVGPGLAILQTPNLQLPSGKLLSDANLVDWIHNGGGGMPGFQQIQGAQMDELIAFLKETTKGAAASAGGTPLGAASTAQGKTTFDANCSPCHNLTTEAKVGPGLAILQTPNLKLPNGKELNDANLAEWIHTGGGGMPSFAQIQGDQLNGLIAYLKEATKTSGSQSSATVTAVLPTETATAAATATPPATATAVPPTETPTAAATATPPATATAVPPTETPTTAATATTASSGVTATATP